MATPGQSSGTYTFALSNASIVAEAFDRIGIEPAEIDRHKTISARTSLNLAMVEFSNKGVNLWEIVQGTINLVPGQATYTLPANIVTLTEVWYTTVNGNGSGFNNDRIMTPATRTQYAMIPNKLQPGIPTLFWYDRLISQNITVWEPPQVGAPTNLLSYFALTRMQDAGIGGGETPDIVYRGLDALCGNLAVRLAGKFAPERKAEVKADSDEAWTWFTQNDQEMGPVIAAPNVGVYGKL